MKTNYKSFTNLFKSQLLLSSRNKITKPYLNQIFVRPSSLHINPNLSLHSSSKLNHPMTATQSVQNVQDLIERNKIWAENFKKNHADRLQSNASGQSPKVLWIGCSDSRVPETEILQCIPGDIFVHRNIANVVVPSDVSYLSVLQYAVEHLKVEEIVVCGHTKCGGVHASLSPNKHGFVDNWLHNIKMVAESHKEELDTIKDPEQKANRLIELNVQQSVSNLTNSLPVKEAWERGQKLTIHGWVYDVATGLVRDLKINKKTNGH